MAMGNMDFLQVPELFHTALAILVMSLLLYMFFKHRRAGHGDNGKLFPRGPPAWPILGHLPLFASGCPHRTLADLSRRHGYGPIIGLRLGCRNAIVLCSASLAREILLTHDQIFANRPPYQFIKTLLYGYNCSVSFSCYGPQFSRFRRIYSSELFAPNRLHQLQYIRQEEAHMLLHRLLQASCDGTQAVDLKACFAKMSANTMNRMMQSKTLSEEASGGHGEDSLPELIEKLVEEAVPTLGDFIPSLKCMDVFQKRSMKHVHDCLDKVIDSILNERREAARGCPTHELPHDFLQVLLSKEAAAHSGGSPDQEEPLTTQQIKGIMLDILAAGIHTTALTLEWAMAELLRNLRCFEKVREEVDAAMAGAEEGRLVRDEDLSKLPYLESVVKEVMRLHPVVPLLLPRISSQECRVGKYILPKGTQVFVNVWALGRDAEVWGEDAERFEPERFEVQEKLKGVDVRGQHFDLLPFGSGRRTCPGMRLGLSVVQVTIANLIRTFDWELPHGQAFCSIDMTEKRGISNCKAVPLLAIPKPRPSKGSVQTTLRATSVTKGSV